MRNIKFRAYTFGEGLKKSMYRVKKIDFSDGEILCEHEYIFKFSEVELMQFTGLKDCRGCEIYNGDIVRLVGDLKKIYENFDYYNTISEVIFDNNEICFSTPRIALPLNKTNCIYFEVVGNIYQTPEILEALTPPRAFTETPNLGDLK